MQVSGFVGTRQCLSGGSAARLDSAVSLRRVCARPSVVRATATTEEKAEDKQPKLTFGTNARAVSVRWGLPIPGPIGRPSAAEQAQHTAAGTRVHGGGQRGAVQYFCSRGAPFADTDSYISTTF